MVVPDAQVVAGDVWVVFADADAWVAVVHVAADAWMVHVAADDLVVHVAVDDWVVHVAADDWVVHVAAEVWVVTTDDWVDASCPSMRMMLPGIVIKLLKWLDYTRQWKEKSCTTNLLPSSFLAVSQSQLRSSLLAVS